MSYHSLSRLAHQTGAVALLEQVGLRGYAGELARLVASAEARARWRALRRDYRATAPVLAGVARGAPAGDPDRPAWVVASLPLVAYLKLDGVMSLAARLAGFSPVAVHLADDPWSRRYYRLFGLRRSLRLARFLPEGPADGAGAVDELIGSRPGVGDLLGFRYRGVEIGRAALSGVLYRRHYQAFDLDQPETLAEVRAALLAGQRNVRAVEAMLARSRPALVLLFEKGLSPMAELVGVCLERGLPVVQYSGCHRADALALKRYRLANRHDHPFSLDGSTWERVRRLPWGPARDAEVLQEIEVGYGQGTWFDRKFLHLDKTIKTPDQVRRQLGLDPARKTAVIFSHVLWDATFFYGANLFEDYETWLVETIRAACRNPRVNWVVKLHPDLAWKLRHMGYRGEARELAAVRAAVERLPDHVRLVLPETDLSTYSFFPVTDYCLTVRGTIGIEMACHGIPVLTAGSGRYAGRGFTLDSASPREYLDRLAGIEQLPPMSGPEIELARRYAWALFQRRPWEARAFAMPSRPVKAAGDPLSANLVVRVRDFAQFAASPDIRALADWLAGDAADFWPDPEASS